MPGNALGKNRRGRTEARKKPGKLQLGSSTASVRPGNLLYGFLLVVVFMALAIASADSPEQS
jgi:hypothetical protein